LVACKVGNAVAVQALLEAGADIKRKRPGVGPNLHEAQARSGANGLVIASEAGFVDVVKILLDAGGIDPGSR
jgi:ankyrin repeat protein